MKKLLSLFVLIACVSGFSQVMEVEDLKFPKQKAPKIVKPYKFEMKNGLTVLLLEDRSLPIVNGRILFHTGGVVDPQGKDGLADIVGTTMRSAGNSMMTSDEMDQYLESVAASVESFSGDTSSGVSFSCLTDNTDKVMELFKATIMSPVFEEEKVTIYKGQMKSGVMRRNDDPKGIVAREFSRLSYGMDSHLSGMVELASIDAVTADDLKAFHTAYYVPNNAVLAVWGDFDKNQMKKTLTTMFKDWKPAKVKDMPLNIQPAKPGVYTVERDGVTQSNIYVGHLGIKKDHPDYAASVLFSRLLGGGFDSKMMQIIRRDMGLSYSPHGGISSEYGHEGLFSMRVNTKLESTGLVLDTLNSIIKDFQTKGVTQEELDLAKDAYLNSYVFQFDSLDKIIGRQLTFTFYDYPENFNETFFKALDKVTTEDIKRVAKELIHQDKFITVVLGTKSKFDKPLSEFGPVTELDITIPTPEVEKEDVAKSAATLKKGYELCLNAVNMIDPDSKLNNVETFKTASKASLKVQGQTMNMDTMAVIKFPGMYYEKRVLPMGEMELVATPEKAEMRMMGQVRPLPAAQKEKMLEGIAQSMPAMVQFIRGNQDKSNYVKTEELNGVTYSFVELELGASPVTLLFNENGELAGTIEPFVDQQGNAGDAVTLYSNYQMMGGILYPTHMELSGNVEATVDITEIVINPEGVDELFK